VSRWPQRVVLVALSVLLTACPQLLSDDYRIDSPVVAAGGTGTGAVGGTSGGASISGSDVGGNSIGTSPLGGGHTGAGGTIPMGGAPLQSGGASSDTSASIVASGGHLQSTTDTLRTSLGGSEVGGESSFGGSMNLGGAAGGEDAGAGGATSASGGATAVVTDCTNMVKLTEGLVADFDSWDGATELTAWRFAFGGNADLDPVTGALDQYTDGTGRYVLEMSTGAASTAYSVCASNVRASKWGGGVRLLLHCLDVTGFTGLTFWVFGATPATKAEVSLNFDWGDVSYEFTIPNQWKQLRVPLALFSGWGMSQRAKGVTGISFSSQLNYPAGDPVPGEYRICVDQVAFY